jgi:hypothetical protein
MSSKIVVNFPGGEVLQVDGSEEFVEKLLKDDVAARALQSLRTPPAPTSDGVVLEQGMEHAWEWFSLHAGHRMQSVNFFLVAVAFISAGYVTAFRFSEPAVAFGVAVGGILLTVCFNLFERRIRQLVHAGEAALTPIEDRLAGKTDIAALRILKAVATPSLRIASYSRVINALHLVTIITFLGGAVYAFKAVSQGSAAAPPVPPWSVADTQRIAVLVAVVLGFYVGARLLETGPLAADVRMLRIRAVAGVLLIVGAAIVLLRVAWRCC